MNEPMTPERLRELTFECRISVLQSDILQYQHNDPARLLLQHQLDEEFRARYGNRPVVTGGGAHFNPKTGETVHVVSTSAGPRYESGKR